MYQQEELYDWCDREGLMVWQEVMAALQASRERSRYCPGRIQIRRRGQERREAPTTTLLLPPSIPFPPPFLPQFQAELRHQIRRLSHHPSIALWGGNNEVESSFKEYEAVQREPMLYASDFSQLFAGRLREVAGQVRRSKGLGEGGGKEAGEEGGPKGGVFKASPPLLSLPFSILSFSLYPPLPSLQLDPGRPYVDTSPSNMLHAREPYIKRWGDPKDPRFGDVSATQSLSAS
jgi:hypothetical protein